MRLRNVRNSRIRIEESEYCVNNPDEYKGKWKSVFGNNNPIYAEIGMGKGLFIIKMAQKNPDINYIGIEMYSSVLVRAVERAEKAQKNGTALKNVVFIRMDARELTHVFEHGEIKKIYLNFSDPWPKERHAKRRLTSREFLNRYIEILPEGSEVEFKTDNPDLFDFSAAEASAAGWKIIAHTRDLHNDPSMNFGNIMTEYEEKFSALDNPISKLIIQRP